MGDHLAVVARVTGVKFQPPELPRAVRYLWNHYVLASSGRGGNGFGPNPISWQELKAYCDLTQTILDPWEIEAIRALDVEYLGQMHSSE